MLADFSAADKGETTILKSFLIWTFGGKLGKASLLASYLPAIIYGVLSIILLIIVGALAVLAGAGSLYLFLIAKGFLAYQALVSVAGVLFFVILGGCLIIFYALAPRKSKTTEEFEALVANFIEGLMEPQSTTQRSIPRKRGR